MHVYTQHRAQTYPLTGKRTPTFNGAIDRGTFDVMTDHIVAKYFSQPNYMRVQTKAGGPKCAYFSIYEISTFAAGMGGLTQARAALDAFRAKAVAAGEACQYKSRRIKTPRGSCRDWIPSAHLHVRPMGVHRVQCVQYVQYVQTSKRSRIDHLSTQ